MKKGAAAAVFALYLIVLGGCGGTETSAEPEVVVIQPPQARDRQARNAARSDDPVRPRDPRPARERPGGSAFVSGGESRRAATRFSGFDDARITGKVIDIVRDSASFRPTLVVWIVDRSPSARRWSDALDVLPAIGRFYESLAAAGDDPAGTDALETAVVTFGQDVQFPIETPSSNPADVVRALESISEDPSGREMTFTAIRAALDRYLAVRKRQERHVLFFVVTDEAGDDDRQVDEVAADPRKYGLPIYVVGVPAPFGRSSAVADDVERGGRDSGDSGGGDAWRPIRQGAESVSLERVDLEFPAGSEDPQMRFAIRPWELMDSGFGPYALERLCHESGGTFFATRIDGAWLREGASSGDWPMRRYDSAIMRRYAPFLVSRAEYEAMVTENRACAALLAAARLPRTRVLDNPTTEFVKRDEANLVRLVNNAQRAAAEVEPAINRMYDLLAEGARDRDNIRSLRLEVGYDLAFGRAGAAKARVDGYNAMLAALKRGRPFEKETSTTWVLEPSDAIETGTSTERIAERAKELLERIVAEHPGTPWADLAAAELRTPLGWKWSER